MKSLHDPGGKVRLVLAAGVTGDALFGGHRREYRYVLRRSWDESLPATMFVMMNPSVADVNVDDPTIARCQAFARSWGSGSIYVVNTFAYRATDQRRLITVPDPVGPENDKYILATAKLSQTVVLAYGRSPSALRQRGFDVCALLRKSGYRLHALKLNADGSPRHPLYLSAGLTPFPI